MKSKIARVIADAPPWVAYVAGINVLFYCGAVALNPAAYPLVVPIILLSGAAVATSAIAGLAAERIVRAESNKRETEYAETVAALDRSAREAVSRLLVGKSNGAVFNAASANPDKIGGTEKHQSQKLQVKSLPPQDCQP